MGRKSGDKIAKEENDYVSGQKSQKLKVSNGKKTGTTKAMARKIRKLTGGDLLQIKSKKYTSDYDKLQITQKGKVRHMKEDRRKVFCIVSIILMSVVIMCTLIACGKENNANDTPEGKFDEKVLIAYFSWSGNSKSEAELIQEKTGGTLFEIVREEPYPKDYTKCTEVAKEEKEENARPSIKNPPESVSEYEKIVVCYPIWWHTAPMCVGTFLEAYDLQGKTVYPVSQSASMDEDQFEESVQFVKDCAKGADVEEGLFVDADDADAVGKYVQETILK